MFFSDVAWFADFSNDSGGAETATAAGVTAASVWGSYFDYSITWFRSDIVVSCYYLYIKF